MKHENGTKSLVTLSYLAMVAINAAAVLLPINGVSTKQVSDTYANLFALPVLRLLFGLLFIFYLADLLCINGHGQKNNPFYPISQQ